MNFGRTLRVMHRRVRPDAGAESIDLGKDELFEILADSRRRYVLERLADDERAPPTCAELAVEIAADETHMDPEHVPSRRVDPVEADLRAEQLPRLVGAGLVRWEGDAGAVRPGHSVEAVAGLLGEADRRVRREPAFSTSPWTAGGSTDAPQASSHPRS